MKRRSDLVALAAFTVILSYAITVGATFNGILAPDLGGFGLWGLGAAVGLWLVIRWWRGWKWHRSPLDGVFLVWGVAFGLSLVTNLEVGRRIAIGLWYMWLYVGVWYVLHDVMANRAARRETLIDALLIAGIVIVMVGYLQLRGAETLLGVRPVSVFGNPNFLGCFLTVLIPLSAARAAAAENRINRIGLGLYAILSLGLLFFTFSRGAWLGTAAGLGVLGVLLLARGGMLSRTRLRQWWGQQSGRIRGGLLVTGVVVLIAVGGVVAVFVESFSSSGRSTDLRAEIYQSAVDLFSEQPIAGQGLYTFGREMLRLGDRLPDKAHAHAHSAPLHIVAELGLVGLAALALTLVVMARQMRRNWQQMNANGRVWLAGGAGAVMAFAIHHLFDMPAMMPAIALTGLVALGIAIEPAQLLPMATTPVRRGTMAIVVAGWAVFFVSGVWSQGVYSQYVTALRVANQTGDYRGAAAGLDVVIAADPALSLYHFEQGFLLGMAASDGDEAAIPESVAAFEKFVMLEPGDAIGWTNLAALRWQMGDAEGAIDAGERATVVMQDKWWAAVNLAMYAADKGENESARAALQQALRVYPDAFLYPEVGMLAEQIGIEADLDALSVPAQAVLLLDEDDLQGAEDLLTRYPDVELARDAVIRMVLALAQDEQEAAIEWLHMAESLAGDTDTLWIYLGRARLAQFNGNARVAENIMALLRDEMQRDVLDGDYADGLSIPYGQFMRLAIPRFFVPQVYYPVGDPVLLMFLADE